MEAGEEWRLAEMPVVITSRCGTSRAISISLVVRPPMDACGGHLLAEVGRGDD